LQFKINSCYTIQSTDTAHFELSPSPLVSSFSGKHGHVFYMVQAVLKTPFHENQRVCRELCILNPIDVNMPSLIVSMSKMHSVFLRIPILWCASNEWTMYVISSQCFRSHDARCSTFWLHSYHV